MGGLMSGMEFRQQQTLNNQVIQDNALKLKKAQEELTAHEEMLQILSKKEVERSQNNPAGLPLDSMQVMRDYADANLQAGRPEEAIATFEKMGKLELDAANTQDKIFTTAKNSLTQAANGLDPANVHDQTSWEGYWQNYFMIHPEVSQNPQIFGQIMKIAGTPYTPEMRDNIRNQVLSQLDRVNIKLAQARVRATESQAALEDYKRTNYYPQLTQQAQARTEAIKKVGAYKPPTSEEIGVVTNMIQQDFPGTDPAVAKTKALPIAERMKELMVSGGLSKAEAAQVAYKEALRDPTAPLGGLKPGRVRPGSSASNPLTLTPQNLKAKDFKLKPNQFYLVNGQVHRAVSETELEADPVARTPPIGSTDDEEDEVSPDDEENE